jgi:CBS domain containing-hemolysin-like protein
MDETYIIAIQAGLLLILVAGSALFSGAETALFSLGRARLLQYADDPRPDRRRTAQLMRTYNRTLIALVAGNMFVNTGISVMSSKLLLTMQLSPAQTTVMSALLAVVVLLVFGEITPKAVALQYSERLSCWLSGPTWWLRTLLAPILSVMEWGSAKVLNLLGRRRSSPLRPEEYSDYVEMAYSIGAFSDQESELLKHVFMLRQLRINRVMTPRVDVPCVRRDLSPAALIALVQQARRPFFPVVNETLDDATAILSVRNFFALDEAARQNWATSGALFPAVFIPESTSLTKALRTMASQAVPVALAADEYGGIVGMLEQKQVFGEIVGEIETEYERPAWQIHRESPTSWRINGQIPLDALRELLPWLPPPPGETHTLNGLFATQLDRIPQEGDRITFAGMELTAVAVHRNRVVEAVLCWLATHTQEEVAP